VGVTLDVARFASEVQLEDVPDGVVHSGRRSMLDGLGLAVAGARSEPAAIVRKYLADLGCRDECGILGTDSRVPARFAALANGVAIHADDYDDTQLAVATDRVYGLLAHPTAPVLAAALSAAERAGSSGAEFLTSYLVGTEVTMKIAEAIAPRHYDDGFHTTGTTGAIGAAAAAARLLKLSADDTAVCLGIGAASSAGLRENFGTMTKPFHAGRAAESGVVAADLAAAGFTAAPNILEADRGFFKAAGGGFDPKAIEGVLGNPWAFEHPGVSIKPHPSGSLTHPGMGVMLDLILQHDIRAENVEHVDVWTNRHMPNALIHHRPTNELQAKFSMEFCMSVLLLERRAGLAEFTDDCVLRKDVQEMIRRVEFIEHPEAEATGYNLMTTIIRIELKDGALITGQADFGKGSPQKPMTDDELVGKFTECLAWNGFPESTAKEAADMILNIELEPSVEAVVKLLSTTPAA
jgi:2-methylcitrate dehydratase PrpD